MRCFINLKKTRWNSFFEKTWANSINKYATSKHWKNVNSFEDLIKRSLRYSGMVSVTEENSECSKAGKQLRDLFSNLSLISKIICNEDIFIEFILMSLKFTWVAASLVDWLLLAGFSVERIPEGSLQKSGSKISVTTPNLEPVFNLKWFSPKFRISIVKQPSFMLKTEFGMKILSKYLDSNIFQLPNLQFIGILTNLADHGFTLIVLFTVNLFNSKVLSLE